MYLALTRRRVDGLTQGALAYLILLSPALGLFKSGRMIVADRWSYLPAIPPSLLAAAAAVVFVDPGPAAGLVLG